MDIIFYTARQVSETSGLDVDWVWRQAREGRIRHHQPDRSYRWTGDDLATLAEQTAVAQITEAA